MKIRSPEEFEIYYTYNYIKDFPDPHIDFLPKLIQAGLLPLATKHPI